LFGLNVADKYNSALAKKFGLICDFR
jgi:hypothetical protein